MVVVKGRGGNGSNECAIKWEGVGEFQHVSAFCPF